jgi:hypothetical protein
MTPSDEHRIIAGTGSAIQTKLPAFIGRPV